MAKWKVVFSPLALEQATDLSKVNPKLVSKLMEVVLSVSKSPFKGIGKPEPLKGNMSGLWSRRINGEHRLVYEVKEGIIEIHSCFGHYTD